MPPRLTQRLRTLADAVDLGYAAAVLLAVTVFVVWVAGYFGAF